MLSTRNTIGRLSRTRLAADIGGTFTDVAAFDEKTGRLLLGKALSTPSDLEQGITHGVEKAGARYADAALFLHGSTIAINIMLERTGSKTALITTESFSAISLVLPLRRMPAVSMKR